MSYKLFFNFQTKGNRYKKLGNTHRAIKNKTPRNFGEFIINTFIINRL